MKYGKIVSELNNKGYFAEFSYQKNKDCIIVAKDKDDELRAVFYTEMIDSKGSEDEAVEYIIDTIENGDRPEASDILKQIENDRIIIPCLRPVGTEDTMGTYTDTFIDLELFYRILIKVDGEYGASTKVTKELMKALNLTPSQLYLEGYAGCRAMTDVSTMFGIFTVLSYKDGAPNGAGAMMNTEVLGELYEKFDGPFYILPSSVNEVIAIADSDELETEKLMEMVKSINSSDVITEEDFLSDSVYYYNGVELTIAP